MILGETLMICCGMEGKSRMMGSWKQEHCYHCAAQPRTEARSLIVRG